MGYVPQVSHNDLRKSTLQTGALVGPKILSKMGLGQGNLRSTVAGRFAKYGKDGARVEKIMKDLQPISAMYKGNKDALSNQFLKAAKAYVTKSRLRNLSLRRQEYADDVLGSQRKNQVSVNQLGKQTVSLYMSGTKEHQFVQNNNVSRVAKEAPKTGFAMGGKSTGFAGGNLNKR